MMSPCSLLCQPKLSSNAITEEKALQELNFQPLVLAAARWNPLMKVRDALNKQELEPKHFSEAFFRLAVRTNPTCPTNTQTVEPLNGAAEGAKQR